MEREKHAANYFGRGISVYGPWKEFVNFYADMGRKPTPKHTLERIENNGNYGPDNCKWATKAEQNDNKRTVRKFQYNGEAVTISQIHRRYAPEGLSRNTLANRLVRAGYSVETALFMPVRSRA